MTRWTAMLKGWAAMYGGKDEQIRTLLEGLETLSKNNVALLAENAKLRDEAKGMMLTMNEARRLLATWTEP